MGRCGAHREQDMQTVDTNTSINTSAKIQVLSNYINGEWTGDAQATLLPVVNPATGETVARVPLSSTDTVDRAARAAHEAYHAWRHIPPIERARYMYPLRDLLLKHSEELARTVTI